MLFPSCHSEYWAIILPAAALLCFGSGWRSLDGTWFRGRALGPAVLGADGFAQAAHCWYLSPCSFGVNISLLLQINP